MKKKWLYLYYFLAAFDILAICLTLYVNRTHLVEFSHLVDKNIKQVHSLEFAGKLLFYAQRANAPGNDVFDTGNAKEERNKFNIEKQNFLQSVDNLKAFLKMNNSNSNRLESILFIMDKMINISDQIFNYYEQGKVAKAGKLMASMDREYGNLVGEIELLRNEIIQLQTTELTRYQEHLQKSQRNEAYFSIFVLFAVIGIIFYGHNSSKMMEMQFKSSQVMQNIVTNSNDGIISYDNWGKILTWNKKAEQIFGHTEIEMLGESIEKIIPEKLYFEELEFRNKINDKKEVSNYLTSRIHKSGKNINVSLTVSSIFSPKRELIGFSKIIRDVSHEMQLQEELEKERLMHIQNSKMATLGEMAAGIAHEINNPLAIISGNIQLVEKFKNDHEKFTQKVEAINKAGKRIEKIVLGLRKFARSSLNAERQILSLNNIVSEVLVLVEAKSKRHSTPVEFQSEENLKIFADEVEIEQVLVNLINNAIDAVKNNTERWIKVFIKSDKEFAVIQVVDSGPGINQEIRDKLFHPFFTTKKIGEGTGLGLSICKGILENHKASIKINSQYSNTCFEIRFPLFLEHSKNVA
jgi:PAS domain S-box-containing protein